jgi:nucleoside-diphosphate-sugar epimerase
MRRRRTGRTAVTGAGTPLGAALLERLPDATPLTGAVTATALRGASTVVCCGVSYDVAEPAGPRRDRTVRAVSAVLEAARKAGAQRVVVVTSTDVHAAEGAALPAGEELPLRADPGSPLVGDLLEVERLADHATRTGLQVAVVRPAPLVGGPLGPAYDSALLLGLSGSRLLAVRGVEPLWQLTHADDLLSALQVVVEQGLTGPVAVASAGWLTQREVERASGRRRLELPAGVAVSTAERLHRTGLSASSPAELDRLLHPLVVEPRRLAEAGWTPSRTAADALAEHLSRLPPPAPVVGAAGVTAGAAGATVALVGTAALVRRARRRGGRPC